eukprot:IDg5699t1
MSMTLPRVPAGVSKGRRYSAAVFFCAASCTTAGVIMARKSLCQPKNEAEISLDYYGRQSFNLLKLSSLRCGDHMRAILYLARVWTSAYIGVCLAELCS